MMRVLIWSLSSASTNPKVKKQKTVSLDYGALQRAGYDGGGAQISRGGPTADELLQNSFSALERACHTSSSAAADCSEALPCPSAVGCDVPPDVVEIYDQEDNTLFEPCWKLEDGQAWLPSDFVDVMQQRGFATTTLLQAHMWPIVMAGRDVLAIAKAGSGKTLAALVPCFAKLVFERHRMVSKSPSHPAHCQNSKPREAAYSPDILVVAPTREKACQIETQALFFSATTGIKTLACCGGDGTRNNQLSRLKERPQCIVATLGRLHDFLESEHHWFTIEAVRFFIVAGAERLATDVLEAQARNAAEKDVILNRLTISFSPTQIRMIANSIETPHRQTIICAAAQGEELIDLASWVLKRPVEAQLGPKNVFRASPYVEQRVVFVAKNTKDDILVTILKKQYLLPAFQSSKTLVFVSSETICDWLAQQLKSALDGTFVVAVHEKRSRAEQEGTISAFLNLNEEMPSILVITYAACCTSDINGVELIINYDPPATAAEYVHQVGCSGKPCQKGLAITLLRMEHDTRAMACIAQVMYSSRVAVPRELADAWKRQHGRDAIPVDRRGVKDLAERADFFTKVENLWSEA